MPDPQSLSRSSDSVDIDRVTRAVDKDGNEWVPLEEYRRTRTRYEIMCPMVVNPRRNVYRAIKALTQDKDIGRALYFLEESADGLDALYETAFPPKTEAVL